VVQTYVFQCLEHGQSSRVQSIFNPDLRPRIAAFIQAFAERYAASNDIESVLLGVTGIFGESIYPAGPEGGWTARLTGDYHNHHGWWAGDPLAVSTFRTAMQRKYGDAKDSAFADTAVARLKSWGFNSFGNWSDEAIAREKEIKGWLRVKKIVLIVQHNPTWRDLSEDWGKPMEPFDEAKMRPPITF